MTADRAVTISLYVAGAVVGGLLALVTAVFVPTGSGVLSLGVLLCAVTIGPYAHFFGRAMRSSLAAAVPPLAWFLMAMVLGGRTAEGDLVLTGSAAGLAFLLVGTVSAAVGIGTVKSGVARGDARAARRAEAAAEAAEAAGVAATVPDAPE